jgi:hypothetical protein
LKYNRLGSSSGTQFDGSTGTTVTLRPSGEKVNRELLVPKSIPQVWVFIVSSLVTGIRRSGENCNYTSSPPGEQALLGPGFDQAAQKTKEL